MGAHDIKLNKVHLFDYKSVNIIVSLSAASTLASLGLKEVQMGAYDIKLNKVHIFA